MVVVGFKPWHEVPILGEFELACGSSHAVKWRGNESQEG